MSAARIRNLFGSGRTAPDSLSDAGSAGRSAALALAIRLANAGLAYLAQVVLARYMGQHEYGVFAFTWVWFMVIAAVASLGMGDAPLRLIPEMRVRGEMEHLRGYIRFAPLAAAFASLTAAIVVILALHAGPAWIDSEYVLPMMVMVIAVPVVCVQSFLEGLGRSYGWVIPALVPNYILRHGLLLVFMVAAVAFGFQANAVSAFACLVAAVLVSLAYQATAILLRLRKALEPGPRAYRYREWFGAALPFSVMYASSYLFSFADVMVLSFFVGPAELAIYFAATRTIQVVNLIPFAATVGAAHLFSAAHAREDKAELQRLASHVALLTFTVALACVIAIEIGGGWLLGMFGAGFSQGTLPLLILAIGVTARVAAGPAEDVLNMTGHNKLSASTYLVAVAASIVLNIALVIPFGITGAAVATSLALTGRAFWLAIAVRRRLGIHTFVWTAARTMLSPPATPDDQPSRSPAE